ncbi:HelD family protein [Streptomyces profundus]|uniref:HelD family protein n=1 Tax=Streptomyces profundus TaxID=2867410 RepID=UPI001D161DDA|nr:AAA family ATPase [Streptomyces sp. MA3_2.13]UED84226.1 AAA family ATPase [Streptomyces sp. MA3_2.13]
MSSRQENGDLDAERRYVNGLYERLDALREQVARQLDATLASTGLGHQGLAERDVTAQELASRLALLDGVENGLCFGRLDMRDEERRYIGRLGLRDTDGTYNPLLIDWRAPAARPFYVATALNPLEVRRRRHIQSQGRVVVGVWDEEFAGTAEVSGDSALLDALNAARTDRMGDIVATIQAEQDEVIRAHHRGVLVVQGGPGTGKTAVALHRAAYLLYTRREQLARSVVLVVGPNPTFLRYIGDVLPSLGETGVLLATVDQLYPGVRPQGAEHAAGATLKGRRAMVEVLERAVADRQLAPDDGCVVEVDRQRLRLAPTTCAALRRAARASGLPHNQARDVFAKLLVDALTELSVAEFGTDVLDGGPLLGEEEIATVRADLVAEPAVRATLDELWPTLSPTTLLAGLLGSLDRLAVAAPGLTEAERAALHRPEAPDGWTAADVPLLDEAAELLGPLPEAGPGPEDEERAHALRLAGEALAVGYGSRTVDVDDGEESEQLAGWDLLDAEALAERQAAVDHRTPARRAAADRTWAFGHVVVDEAQELSPMAWRLLMRRAPARSMTLVGDIAQTGDPGGAPSWDDVLRPHVGDRWRLAELTVNYRLPTEIAEVAAEVLGRIDPSRRAPRAVRESGVRPWWRRAADASPAGLAAEAARLAALECEALPAGRVAVLVPRALRGAAGAAVAALGRGERIVALDPGTAKGLEFDAVVVVDPERMVADGPRGLGDLYVALTRPTRRLGVLHPGSAPPVGLAGLVGPLGCERGTGQCAS